LRDDVVKSFNGWKSEPVHPLPPRLEALRNQPRRHLGEGSHPLRAANITAVVTMMPCPRRGPTHRSVGPAAKNSSGQMSSTRTSLSRSIRSLTAVDASSSSSTTAEPFGSATKSSSGEARGGHRKRFPRLRQDAFVTIRAPAATDFLPTTFLALSGHSNPVPSCASETMFVRSSASLREVAICNCAGYSRGSASSAAEAGSTVGAGRAARGRRCHPRPAITLARLENPSSPSGYVR